MPKPIASAQVLRTREYLRGPEVCHLLGGIHPATLWKWRQREGFPAPVRASASTNWFRTRDVLNWMEGRTQSEVSQ